MGSLNIRLPIFFNHLDNNLGHRIMPCWEHKVGKAFSELTLTPFFH